jgi:hypothetical protein
MSKRIYMPIFSSLPNGKTIYVCFLLLGVALLTQTACNEPTLIGDDLVDEDRLNISFTDTLSLEASVKKIDRIVVFDTIASTINGAVFQYAVGRLEDPVFGKFTAELSFQVRLNEAFLRPTEFDSAEVDSVVLGLRYEGGSREELIAFYGDTLADQQLDIHLLTEPLDERQNYLTDQLLAYDPVPVGSKGPFVAKRTDSISFIDLDTVERQYPAQLRIPLDNELVGQKILDILTDSVNLVTSNFLKEFPGFHLRSVADNNSVLGFTMPSAFSELSLYYTIDTIKRRIDFPISGLFVRSPYYEHDHSSGTIQPFLDNETGDSLCFSQGAAGVLTRVSFPTASALRGSLINKAELELTLADLPEDDPDLYGPARFLIGRLDGDDGNFSDIEDVGRIFTWYRDFSSWTRLLGGTPEEKIVGSDTLQVYRINISSYFQDVVDGKIDDELVVYPFFMRQSPQRIVFYGTSHSEYPMRLRVSYTKP